MQACIRCASTDLFEMDLEFAGEPAHFVHCRLCEHRYWTDPAGTRVLALREVVAG